MKPRQLFTGEDLLLRPDLNPCELVDGQVVPRAPSDIVRGCLIADLGTRLLQAAHRGEVAVGGVGVYIRRNPDTVRAADIAVLSKDRREEQSTEGFLDPAPELVVEVASPKDRWAEILEKLEDYFSAGVERVWIVDPRDRRVFVYRTPAERESFEIGQILRDEDLLPGFSVPVADLFED